MASGLRSAPNLDEGRLADAVERLRDALHERGVPAAALAVATGSRGVVRVEAYSQGARQVSADSVFPIASITKPIVATALMQLVADGRLILDVPLSHYIPEFAPPPAGRNLPGAEVITVWHLLTHTSGLRDRFGDIRGLAALGRDGALEGVCTRPLASVPGATYSYCSDSFFLLGEVIARLRRQPYPDAVRERIFDPLGMDSTHFDPAGFGDRAVPVTGGGSLASTDEIRAFIDLEHPGGGLWSTATDVARFGLSILGAAGQPRILAQPFIDLMTREQTAGIKEVGMPPRDPHYGLGWGLDGLGGRRPCSPRAFGHGGASGSLFVVDPAYDLVFVFLRSEWGAPVEPEDVALQLLYAAFEGTAAA